MTAKEKYNLIIDTIEELSVAKEYDGYYEPIKTSEIIKTAFETAGVYMGEKEKNAIFAFLMDKRVIEYIEERKMVAICRYIRQLEKWDSKRTPHIIVEMSGCADFQTFCKKFKKYIDVSPKKAFDEKNTVSIPRKRSWITLDLTEDETELKGQDMKEMKFGIAKDTLLASYKAINMQELYQLNDYESEMAFNLSQQRGYDIEEAFEYFYDYLWLGIEDNIENRDESLEKDLLNEKVLHMYFGCKMTFNEILYALLAERRVPHDKDILSEDRLYIRGMTKYYRNAAFVNPEKTYDEIYEYFCKNVHDKSEDFFLRFVENASGVFSSDLNLALKFTDSDEMTEDYKEFNSPENQRYDESEYEDWEPESEYWDEYLDGDSENIDYSIDYDDFEVAENLFLDSERLEEQNQNVCRTDFTEEDFYEYCLRLDSQDSKLDEIKHSRKIRGFSSLDLDLAEKLIFPNFEIKKPDNEECPF